MSEALRERENALKELACRIMQERYGTEFTALRVRPQSNGGFYAWLMPVKQPGCIVKAALSDDGSGCADNYTGVKLCRRITGIVRWDMREYPGDCFVHTSNILEYTPPELSEATPAEYLKQYPQDRFDVNIIVSTEGLDCGTLYKCLMSVKDSLQQEGIRNGYIDIFAVGEDLVKRVITITDSSGSMSDTEICGILNEGGRASASLATAETMPSERDLMKGLEK